MQDEKVKVDKLKEMSDAFKEIGEALKPLSEEIANFFLDMSVGINNFNKVKKLLRLDDSCESLINAYKETKEFFQNANDKMFKNCKTAFSDIKGYFMDLVAAFKTGGMKGVFDELSEKVKALSNSTKGSLAEAKDNFKGFFSDIKERGGNTFDTLRDKGKESFKAFKSNPFSLLTKSLVGFGAVATGVFAVGVVGGIALAVAAIAGFAAYFNQLMKTNEEFREKITTAWAGVKEAFKPAIDAFGELFACLSLGKESVDEQSGEIADSFLSFATTIIEGITSVVTFFSDLVIGVVEFIKGILFTTSEDATGQTQTTWDKITETFSNAWAVIEEIFAIATEIVMGIWELFAEDVIGVFATVWSSISEVINGAVEVVKGVLDIIVGIFTGNGEKIKDGFAGIWKGIKNIFGGVIEFFSGIWDKVVSIFGKVGTKIGDAIGGAFKTVVNTIIGFAEKTINGFLKAINGAISLINAIPGVEIKKLKLLEIPRMATGGLVDPGQMFIAREAGPELVGSFGSRTAVMNNNQIVEAVSRGVYSAVRSAMGRGNGAYTFNITNTLDGKEIGKQVIKYHNGVVKQTGFSPLMI